MNVKIDNLPEYTEFSPTDYRVIINLGKSIHLSEIDFSKIKLKNFLLPGEKGISMEERMLRAEKSGLILLDVRVAFLLNGSYDDDRPKFSWIHEIHKHSAYSHHSDIFVSFDGTKCAERKYIPEIDREVIARWRVPVLRYKERHYATGLCGGEGVVRYWEFERYGIEVDGREHKCCLSAVYEE